MAPTLHSKVMELLWLRSVIELQPNVEKQLTHVGVVLFCVSSGAPSPLCFI